jgi:hypothetical protein
MNRRSHGSGHLRSLLLSRRGEASWLYDHVEQDFRHELDLPESTWPEIAFREPAPRPGLSPRFRMGPVSRGLFVHGWFCVVFLGGLMAFALVAFALGYR